MEENDKQVLREVVEAFVKQQKDYTPNEPIRVLYDESGGYSILYGGDTIPVIIGVGKTPEAALNDFKEKWNIYKIGE